MISKQIKTTCAAACLALSLAGWSSANAEFVVVTGEHWQNSAEEQKRAFLLGAATIIEVEKEMQGSTPPADDESAIPVLVRGLSPLTLTEIMERLDQYYASNPDKLSVPVIRVVYFEMAKPRAEAR
jgi:hypothetical protein